MDRKETFLFNELCKQIIDEQKEEAKQNKVKRDMIFVCISYISFLFLLKRWNFL